MKMNRTVTGMALGIVIVIGQAMAAPPVLTATLPYNEAVRNANGKRQVELPPRNPHYPKLKIAKVGAPFGGNTHWMIEGPDGLLQCTSTVVTAESCEPSDIGTVKKLRTWVVLMKGAWHACIGMAAPVKCQGLYAKPTRDNVLALPPEEVQ
ncbi:hypothetical protein HLB44_30730 [Aquincola sp. S2]|uniref:Uncharacterized protein n=1 Tax=Pseudaquabacterium terrae TaxID=2732868 RepID=A0ABX2ES43_9BURK|nr:hypothetical protein [Aquabacterium terrae]NRF71369.1 hypothetical protein [Aquabacterium terrae]